MKKLSLLIFALGMFFVSCEKDQDAIISSLKIENEKLTPSYTSILVECQLSSKATLRNVFLQYSTSVDFSEYEEIKMEDKTKGNYSANIIGLRDNTIYYIRYAASNTYSSILAEEFSSVTTLEQEVPTLHIDSVLLILDTLATVQFVIDFDGGDSITQTGICWSTETSPTIEKNYIDAPNNDSIVSLCKLQANTIYYVRAYAKNSIGMAYSEEIMFTTLALPEVETNDITDIQLTSALLHGTLLFNGNDTATIKGFCWSEDPEPTTNDEYIVIDTTGNTFAYLLSNLKDETQYYVRAYAQNKIGISYARTMPLITKSAMAPTVTTMNVSDIGYHSAQVRGNVISDGGAEVTERGLCYSIQETIMYIHYPDDNGIGEFTVIMPNLTDSTTYSVRAYAVNKKGYGYGELLSFMTKGYEYPIVTTIVPTNISYTSATVGGNVTSAGGAEITERGICYATTQNPTIDDIKIQTTKGIGSFSIDLTNLTDTTIYYVRAYAINRKGISYGEQMSFTTKGCKLPSITTLTPTNVLYASATVGGNVISDGGAEVTERGICYSTTENSMIENTKIIIGGGVGEYIVDLINLSECTTYYIRAYAVNKMGVNYGEEVSITTLKAPFENGYEYVDLGLSVKWATMNVGASKPEDYGEYFAWGDVATWGGAWRRPTDDNVMELLHNCNWEWTMLNGVSGCKVTSKVYGYKDKSIFIPAAGCYKDIDFVDVGTHGYLWSSTLHEYDNRYAYFCKFSSNDRSRGSTLSRHYKYSIRLVCP